MSRALEGRFTFPHCRRRDVETAAKHSTSAGFTHFGEIAKVEREMGEFLRDDIRKLGKAAALGLANDICSQYPADAGPASTKEENKPTNF